MFVYGQDRGTGEYVIVDRDHTKVKTQLLDSLTNFGQPIIKVVDGNFGNRGELYLVHDWGGGDLQVDQAKLTLQSLHALWQRPVHIETVVDGEGCLLSYDGAEAKSEKIEQSHPASGRVGCAPSEDG